MGEFQDKSTIRLTRPSCLIVDHKQIVPSSIDPVESKVEIHQILDTIVLQGGAGQPIVGEVVVDPDIAHFGRNTACRQPDIIQPELGLQRQIVRQLDTRIQTRGGPVTIPGTVFSLDKEK